MAVETSEAFFALLSKSNLLSAAQLAEAQRDAAKADPRTAAVRLVRLGWLTKWQAQQLLAGRSRLFLGKYKLLESLGQGGMGAVFKAVQPGMERVVALKVMSRAVLHDPAAIARFLREIQAAAALSHEHIVAAYDADKAGDNFFLVMEYVGGQSLKAWIAKHAPLPIDWSCECARQAALGLQHAHEQGMVHRDIKPANLLVVQNDAKSPPLVKILDMGLARVLTESSQESELTQTGQIMGTPDFIAPEQAISTKSADIRSDIFSLGCTLFQMLTNQLPYTGANVMEKLMVRAMQDAPPLGRFRPDVPTALAQVVARMLAREPRDRYQTPREVVEALTPFAGTISRAPAGETFPTMPSAPPALANTLEAVPDPTLNQLMNSLASGAPVETGPRLPVRSKKPRVFALAVGGGCVLAVIAAIAWPRGDHQRAPARESVKEQIDVTVSHTKSTTDDKPAADIEQRAAEWVLSMGGTLTVAAESGLVEVTSASQLPRPAFQVSFISPYHVTRIRLNGVQNVSDSGLQNLVGLSQLDFLDLESTAITDEGLVHLAGLTRLNTLVLTYTQVTGPGLTHLKRLRSLEQLLLNGQKLVTGSLKPLRELDGLTNLDLSGVSLSDEDFADLAQLTSLQNLGLRGWPRSVEQLSHLKALSALKILNLTDTGVPDAGLARLAPLTSLTNLATTNSTQLTGEGFASWNPTSHLESLNLAGCAITDAGLVAISRLNQLTSLAFDSSARFTPAGLKHLATLPKLTNLDLTSYPVTDETVAELVHLATLLNLRLGSTPITDAGLETLASKLHLAQFILPNTAITDRGLEHLNKMPGLTYIEVAATKVTKQGVETFRKNHPDCTVISEF